MFLFLANVLRPVCGWNICEKCVSFYAKSGLLICVEIIILPEITVEYIAQCAEWSFSLL